MTWKKKVIWGLVGAILAFVQSFFLKRWLTLIWVIVLSWKEEEFCLAERSFGSQEQLILIIGLIDDLLLFEPLGKGGLIYLGTALMVKWVKKIMGLGKNFRVKISNF